MTRVIEQVVDLVFPATCIGCGYARGSVLCGRCLSRLASANALGEVELEGDKPVKAVAFDGFRAAGPYRGVLREMVLKLKSSCRPFAVPLARLMVAGAGNHPDYLAPDLVCFVPSERRKVAQRGYNPAGVLAREVSVHLGRPLVPCLVKARVIREQDGLPGVRRWDNVSGAFEAAKGFVLRGNVLLVDDVLTTGATAHECAGALVDAGAESVHVLVAARAVLHKRGG